MSFDPAPAPTPPPRLPLSSSPELVEHHAQLHGVRCPARPWWGQGVVLVSLRLCPCRPPRAVVYVCAACEEPLYLAVEDQSDVCPHGQEAMRVLL